MQVQEEKPYDEINITPMLDLAYVLLVIFILMTTATVTGLKASLPRASKSAKVDPETKMKAIIVDNQGHIFLDKAPVTLADLEARLKAHKAAKGEFPVVIKGDSTTPYQTIVDVLELVSRLGIQQIGLPTKPRK
jgi:biopolymer transport protein ExbD